MMPFSPPSRTLLLLFILAIAASIFVFSCYDFFLLFSLPPSSYLLFNFVSIPPSSHARAYSSQLLHSWTDEELFLRALESEKKYSFPLTLNDSLENIHQIDSPSAEKFDLGRKNIQIPSIKSNLKGERSTASSFCQQTDQNSPSLLRPSPSPSLSSSSSSSSSSASSSFSRCLQRSSISCPSKSQRKPWKIAFLFLTRESLPFAPLWNLFFHGHQAFFNVYVHGDPNFIRFNKHTFYCKKSTDVFCNRFIHSEITERGAPSLAAAERRLIANALIDDPLNMYFALLSDHCIPLRSFNDVYKQIIMKSQGRSFIEILTEAASLRARYNARGGEEWMLPEVPWSSFRVGSQFFVVNRDLAVSIIADKEIWRKFNKPCNNIHNCYVEEHYFSTFVAMGMEGRLEALRSAESRGQGVDAVCVEPRTLTYVEWPARNDGHPRSFRREEVDRALIQMLRGNGSFVFARKFEDDALEPLLHLTAFILYDDDDDGGHGKVGRVV